MCVLGASQQPRGPSQSQCVPSWLRGTWADADSWLALAFLPFQLDIWLFLLAIFQAALSGGHAGARDWGPQQALRGCNCLANHALHVSMPSLAVLMSAFFFSPCNCSAGDLSGAAAFADAVAALGAAGTGAGGGRCSRSAGRRQPLL